MRPSASRSPMIYGLPKIHKDNILRRPIVSCIGSPTYRLAKHLVHIIGPLAGQTPSFVKNSRHFVQMVKGEKIDPEEKLVSFDVESLFTNVPVEESIEIIKRRLREDMTVEERTSLSRNTVVDLLDLCLKSTYFQYRGEFYQQVDGAAMGSPVSPIVANIYMVEFEHQALNTAPERPRQWKRYVDDTFCIMKGSAVEGFLAHLNSLKPTIRFAMELETQGRLPFLDACLQKQIDGSLVTSEYRKPTHTDREISTVRLTSSIACEERSGEMPVRQSPEHRSGTRVPEGTTTSGGSPGTQWLSGHFHPEFQPTGKENRRAGVSQSHHLDPLRCWTK